MSKYPSYDKMKDSGVEWLGEIPEHWEIVSLKYLMKVKDGTHNTPEFLEPSNETRPLITTKDITNGEIDFRDAKHISIEDHLKISNRSNVENNDVIMPMIGTIGNPVVVKTEKAFSIKNVALFKTSESNFNSNLLSYFLDSKFIKTQFELMTRGGVQSFISLDVLRNLMVLDMPKDEKKAIVNFLDRETGRIDKLIEKKEELIELLAEKRQATISQAVTKGLDSDVKMKDSGIEWLGEIPEHWSMTSLRNLTRFIEDGTHGSFSRRDIGIPLLSAKNIQNGSVKVSNTESLISEEDYETITSNSSLKKGDLLLTIVGTIGRVAIFNIDEKVAFQRSVCMMGTNENLLTEYAFYLIQTSYFQDELLSKAKQSAQSGVYLGDVASSIAIVPSLEEQKEIANYLEKEINKIDKLIDKTEEQIANLKEYRQALISNAVTGKIKVTKE
ncbi:restriction endonuclease subunit S [Halanaerocella petrolearia]